MCEANTYADNSRSLGHNLRQVPPTTLRSDHKNKIRIQLPERTTNSSAVFPAWYHIKTSNLKQSHHKTANCLLSYTNTNIHTNTTMTMEDSISSLIAGLQQSCTCQQQQQDVAAKLAELQSRFTMMKQELDRSQQSNVSLQAKLQNVEEMNQQLEEENEELREVNEQLEEENEAMEDQIAEMEEFAVEEAAKKMALEVQLNDSSREINELHHKVEKVERKLRCEDIPHYIEFVVSDQEEFIEDFDDEFCEMPQQQGGEMVYVDVFSNYNELIVVEEKQVLSPSTSPHFTSMKQQHFQTPTMEVLPLDDKHHYTTSNLEAAIAAKLQIDTSKLQQVLCKKQQSSTTKSSGIFTPSHRRDSTISAATTTRSPVSVVH